MQWPDIAITVAFVFFMGVYSFAWLASLTPTSSKPTDAEKHLAVTTVLEACKAGSLNLSQFVEA